MRRTVAYSSAVLPVVTIAAAACCAADSVRGFRGDGSGVCPAALSVVEWSADKNIVWKTKLAGWSNSSPVPCGDRVFVCAEPFSLACLSAADGRVLWQKTNDYAQVLSPQEAEQLAAEIKRAAADQGLLRSARGKFDELARIVTDGDSKEKLTAKIEEAAAALAELKEKWQPLPLERKFRLPGKHEVTGYSTPTPVTDGRHVWALFGNGVAACYTAEGQRKWVRLVEKPAAGHGHTASPLLVDGKLILAINDVHALDAATGEPLWKAASKPHFGTPAAATVGGARALVTAEGQVIGAADGKIACAGMSGLAFNSPVVAGGVAYFFGERDARAYRLPETLAEGQKPAQLWTAQVAGDRRYASPVVAGGVLYGMTEKGLLTALDASTGAKLYDKQLDMGGTCYSSLALAGDRLIAASEKGVFVVLAGGREPGDATKSTLAALRSCPVADGGRLYVRAIDGVYCIGK